MGESGETCSYVHDVSDSDRFPDLGQEWHCGRAAEDGRERCLFHLSSPDDPEKTVERVTQTLAEMLSEGNTRSGRESPRRIIGATLPGVSIPFWSIEGERRYPIDLREASIDGTVDCTAARLGPTLRLDGSHISGDVIFDEAVVEGDLYLNETKIEGEIDARRADIRGKLELDGVQCDGRCILLQARIRHGVHLRNARVGGGVWHGLETEGDIECGKAVFDGPLNIERAVVNGDLSFNNATLENSLRLAHVVVDGATSMNDGRVHGAMTLAEAELHGDFDLRTTFLGAKVDLRGASVADASISRAQFADTFKADQATFHSLTVDSTQFRGPTSLSEATVTADASFSETAVEGRLRLDRATLEGQLSMREMMPVGDSAVIDYTEADIDAGVVNSTGSESVVFDFTRATVGDIRLRPEQSGFNERGVKTDDRTPFESYRFIRTTFDGFDFTDYDTALEQTDWRLHPDEHGGGGFHGIAEPTVADHEKTYTKAKRGASDEGASRAAGAFLIRELEFRRKGHAEQWQNARMLSDTWVEGMYRWSANWLLRLTAGYGERLAPVVGTTAVLISVFALAYAFLLPTPPYDAGIAGYALLSLVSFVTLVLGEVSVGGGVWVQLLAQVEGFLGAFLIALFVFVFTRSVHR